MFDAQELVDMARTNVQINRFAFLKQKSNTEVKKELEKYIKSRNPAYGLGFNNQDDYTESES